MKTEVSPPTTEEIEAVTPEIVEDEAATPENHIDRTRTHYETVIKTPRGNPKAFLSPTYEDAAAGVGSILLEVLLQAPAAQDVKVKVYRVNGHNSPEKLPAKNLVSEVRIDNFVKFHPPAVQQL